MTKYKTVKLQRVYGNVASVRDYVWKDCISKNMGIEFECKGASMKLEPFELLQGNLETKKYKSKFNDKEYSLVNFNWSSKK